MGTIISKQMEVPLSQDEAFDAFINEFSLWWPKAYTWSKDKLVEISINPVSGGHCTEMGPNNFQCDWGTVTDAAYSDYVTIKWQISPSRVPEPDPARASQVHIHFHRINEENTRIELRHDQFENHGDGYEQYHEAMNGAQGWDYILSCFAKHARSGSGITAEVKS